MTDPWNQPILDSLKRRLERMPHALLLHGAPGLGKLALAEALAQLLLCESPDAARRPCGGCDGCRWFLAGNHPDCRRLEPEALMKEPPETEGKPSIVIKIEQVRSLAGFVNLRSHRGRLRVALVHPAEDMNAKAANAFLKSLEEPPSGAIFLLVSHQPARLLPTIRSRCVALPVPMPRREAALAWLAEQGVTDAERWLAYAGGAPRRALEYAAEAQLLAQILGSPAPVDDRQQLERLAEALQKIALDRALSAFGLPPKYRASMAATAPEMAKAWLGFARKMGQHRSLVAHPLSPRLFSTDMLAALPKS